MREIKFRAWEKNLKEMISVDSINFEAGLINMELAWRTFEEIEIMRYTGLKDKNGIEIYEGDIVKRTYLFDGAFGKTHIGKVVYDNESARYVISKPQKYTEPKTEDMRNTLSDRITYEVIGNAYENKELLED